MTLTQTVVFALALGLGGCVTMSPSQFQVSLPSPYTEDGVAVTVDGFFKDGYGVVKGISGIATNVSGKDLSLCQVSLDILDAAGVKVSSALAATNDLKGGEGWRFQASLTSATSASIASIVRGKVTTLSVFSMGRKFDPSGINQLTPGVSKFAEAVSLFGPPQSELNFANGTHLSQWIFADGDKGAQA